MPRRARALRLLGIAALVLCAGCAAIPAAGTGTSSVPALDAPGTEANSRLVPAGFGTLRQDDLAIRLLLPGGLQMLAVPLDESFIRLLSPDSYRNFREILASKASELTQLEQRYRLPSYSLWLVSFFAQEQGETRFSPLEVVIRNVGRDFRPIDIVPLTPGFGEYRLRQRETQSALLIFDGQVDANQPLSLMVETTESSGWQTVLQRVERERALVRSRALGPQRRDTSEPAARL